MMPLLTATSAFRLGRRCQSSPQRCDLHRLHVIFNYPNFPDLLQFRPGF